MNMIAKITVSILENKGLKQKKAKTADLVVFNTCNIRDKLPTNFTRILEEAKT